MKKIYLFIIILLSTLSSFGQKILDKTTGLKLVKNFLILNGMSGACPLGLSIKVFKQDALKVKNNAYGDFKGDAGKIYFFYLIKQDYCTNLNGNKNNNIYRVIVQNAIDGKIKISLVKGYYESGMAALIAEANAILGVPDEYQKEQEKFKHQQIADQKRLKEEEGQKVFTVGNVFQINDFLVMEKDLGKLTFKQAKIALLKLGSGWRLPDIAELRAIWERNTLSEFSNGYYMAGPFEYDGPKLLCKHFGIGQAGYEKYITSNDNIFELNKDDKLKEPKAFVRAVKDIENPEFFGQTEFQVGETETINK